VSESDVGAGEDKHFSSQIPCCRFVKNIHFLMIAYFIVFPFVTVQFVLQGKTIHLNAFIIVVIGGDDDNDEGDVVDDDVVVVLIMMMSMLFLFFFFFFFLFFRFR
jgi:hypothetical protein